MALNNLGLGFMFQAQDMASGVMAKVEKNFNGLEKTAGVKATSMEQHFQVMGGGLAIAGVGLAGLSAAFAATHQFEDFEMALAAVGAVSDATAQQIDDMRKAVLQAGVDTQFNPTQATEALGELAQAGYDVQTSIALLPQVLNLAAGSLGQLSPSEAAGVASQALHAFGIETQFAGAAMDQMLQGANAFAMNAGDLPLGLSVVSRGAQTMNQSLTESVIAFGLVKNVIKGTERAGNGLAVAMERMVDPSVQKKLKELGVTVVDAQGNFRPFLDVMQDTSTAMGKLSIAKQAAFLTDTFGAHALGPIQAILTQLQNGLKTNTGELVKGAAAVAYYRNQFQGAKDVASDFSKRLLDTSKGQKLLLSGSLQTLGIVVGEQFSKVLRPAVEFTIVGVNKLIGLLGKMSPGAKRTAAVVFVLGSALALLVGGIITLGAVAPLFITGLGLATAAFGSLAAATWAAVAPLLPWVILIGALTYGFYKLTGSLGQSAGAAVALTAVFGLFYVFATGQLAGALTSVANGITSMIGPMRTLWALMVANPIGVIVGLLAVLAFAIIAIRNNWGGLADDFAAGMDIIAEKLGTLDRFAATMARLAEAAATFDALKAFNAVSDAVTGKQTGLIDPLKKAVVGDQQLGPQNHGRSIGAQAAYDRRAYGVPKPEDNGAGGSIFDLINANQTAATSAGQVPELDYKKLAATIAEANAKTPQTTVLNVDGERLAEVMKGARRSIDARAGAAVGVE